MLKARVCHARPWRATRWPGLRRWRAARGSRPRGSVPAPLQRPDLALPPGQARGRARRDHRAIYRWRAHRHALGLAHTEALRPRHPRRQRRQRRLRRLHRTHQPRREHPRRRAGAAPRLGSAPDLVGLLLRGPLGRSARRVRLFRNNAQLRLRRPRGPARAPSGNQSSAPPSRCTLRA